MVRLSCMPFTGQAIVPAGDRIGRPYIAGTKTKRIIGGSVVATHVRRCLLHMFTCQSRVRVDAHDAGGVPALATVIVRSRPFAIRDTHECCKGYHANQPDQPMPVHLPM